MDRIKLKKLNKQFGPALLRLTRPLLPFLTRKKTAPRIAVLKIVGMGDTVLMLPVIHLLKKTFPDHLVTVVVTPVTKPLFVDNPDIDELIVYDILGADRGIRGFLRILAAVRRRRFRAFLDFEQNIQIIPFMAAVSGAPVRIGLIHPEHDRGELFTHPVPYDDQALMIRMFHQIYGNYCLAAGRTALPFTDLFSYSIPMGEAAVAKAAAWRRRIANPDDTLIGLHPGSNLSNVSRRWPLDNYRALIGRLLETETNRIVLTGGPGEEALLRELAAPFDPARVIIAEGFNLKEFVAVLSVLDCYVSNDTGPLHIPPWVGTCTVGLFGPNLPARYGSAHGNCVSLYKAFACSPCIQVHKALVPECDYPDKGACIKQITVDEVFRQVVRLAALRPEPPIEAARFPSAETRIFAATA
jgi:heptosyltransferase-2